MNKSNIKYTNAKSIIAARNFFKENPKGVINTGIWGIGIWTKENFYLWFMTCLMDKVRGTELSDKQWDAEHDLRYDARIINENISGIAVRRITEILRNFKMKRKYPNINNFF